ncbi:MAG: zinc ABC transporter substrate-binding protein [Clostridia bacterium]|nr:zinc ABC transporter substrate-binding protein [Clostridia bacterium]
MKKFFASILVVVLMMTTVFSGAALAEDKKLSIVTTIFPIYDWVRAIINGSDHVEITMLLDNGTDLHSYQPSALDIMKVSEADLFIYVGGESDEWVEAVLATAKNPDLVSISLVEAMGDAIKAEEIVEGMEHEHEHGEEEEEEHEHAHEHEEIEPEDIQDRPLSDFAGEWQSLLPLLLAGELDAFCGHKAEEDGDDATSKETYLEKYTANWACGAVSMKIEGDTISFTDENGKTVSGAYTYAGYTPILAEDGDVKSVRYQFTTDSADAPKYVQFNDHGYQPGEAAHFHVYFGSESFDALLSASSNPYFAPADMTTAGILQQLIGHNHEEHEHHHDHEEEEETDEHVWLSLRNAQILSRAIAEALAGLDPDNSAMYRENLAAYCEKLSALDQAYAEMVKNAQYKTVLFADRFPFRYLTDDYGLTYFAAFSGCSAESEASFQTIVFLAQKVDELNLPAVLTIEHPQTRIAETVVSTSQAKNAKILSMDSMQSVTAQDVKAGAAYLAIMENNLAVLREALN